MCAAPLILLGAAAVLCLSPLSLPFIPVLLWYWYREKRAGRTLRLRIWLGNPADPEPDLTELMDRPEPQPDPDEVPGAR